MTAAERERREAVRVQAAELFEQRTRPPEVARCLRGSPKTVHRWHQLWRDGGVAALASRDPSGSRCRPSPHCLEKLAAYLEQGPAAHGWVEDQVWKEATWAEVAATTVAVGSTTTPEETPACTPRAVTAPAGADHGTR
ncbi:hypothetical protein GTY54_50605 [Streptomyces sp. SID625]|nr:hypothetical protein [Streptomyces sp. SID625]